MQISRRYERGKRMSGQQSASRRRSSAVQQCRRIRLQGCCRACDRKSGKGQEKGAEHRTRETSQENTSNDHENDRLVQTSAMARLTSASAS